MITHHHPWFLAVRCLLVLAVALVWPLTAPAEEPQRPEAASETIVLAGGCFWGIQAVFQHVTGVTSAVSGYAGGAADTAHYDAVSSGRTGHAEAVSVTYDPGVVDEDTLLRIFLTVAHDPTQRDRQGADVGTQYRSAIFVHTESQRKTAQAVIARLNESATFTRPIATRIEDGATFYPAEAYHQDYATLHPENPYIAYTDRPKIDALERVFPSLYRATPALVSTQDSRGSQTK